MSKVIIALKSGPNEDFSIVSHCFGNQVAIKIVNSHSRIDNDLLSVDARRSGAEQKTSGIGDFLRGNCPLSGDDLFGVKIAVHIPGDSGGGRSFQQAR